MRLSQNTHSRYYSKKAKIQDKCIDLMSLDLVLRLSEMLRSTASLLESHIAEMSSTYLSGEE